ncbi:hypothetical protein DMO24_02960 [Modestobacter versicolor]|uniref:Uncharacterized protein n=1 Tax=Modestobacter versicolor TaxID=429133 RepID=A0A323VF97_9ACTN|nr:hypothetical protein DMO24_02960 [Modestobacter versicolor]
MASGVLLTTPETVTPIVTLPRLLDIDALARIADLLAAPPIERPCRSFLTEEYTRAAPGMGVI